MEKAMHMVVICHPLREGSPKNRNWGRESHKRSQEQRQRWSKAAKTGRPENWVILQLGMKL